MKKSLRAGAKLLALLASAFLMFNVTACSSDDDDSGSSGGGSGGGSSPSVNPVEVTKITLKSSSGSKTYDTIQAAVTACTGSGEYTILLPKGTYNENYINYNGAATIKISGVTTTKYGADVIITGHGTAMGQEKGRELVEFMGSSNLILENVSLVSDYSRKDHAGDVQAEVLGFDSTGYVAAYNCSFKSHQDTMRTTGKGWFYKCYVEGDTDFIWMESAGIVALYEECEIVSVYDEFASTHASYVLAPRATVANTMGKGAVIFNSTLKCENDSNFLFRNPWGTNKDYYNQGAFVDVTITAAEGKVVEAALAKSAAMGTSDQQYIGWKVDSTIASAYAGKMASIGTISDTVKANEYSGRRAILNRNYSVKYEKFLKDAEKTWNIDSFISKMGWTVSADSSKDLLDNETESQVTTYVLDSESVSGLTCEGFALEAGKTHYAGKADSTIKFDVTGPCTVSVTGYYAGEGTIQAGTQGKSIYNCTNGSTSKFVTKDYVVYTQGTSTVTVTATATSYLTKIVVVYDNGITFNPVTTISVSAADNVTEVAGKKTVQFSATVAPANASNTDYVWSVSPEAAGTIDGSGLFTAADVTEVTEATVTATALDANAVTGSLSIKVNPASANSVDFTWLDNTEGKLGGVSSNTEIATVADAVTATSGTNKAGETITGTWAYNSSKSVFNSSDVKGLTLTAADDNPLKGEWYVEYPITAVVPLRINTIKMGFGNGGTDNLCVYVTYSKNDGDAIVLYDDNAKETKINPRKITNASFDVYQVLAAGDTAKIRVSIHGEYSAGGTDGVQTFSGKSPTWGATVISAEAGSFPVAGQTYTYNLCSSDNLKAAGSTSDELFSWSGANPGSGHGLQAGTGTLKVAGNVKITVGLCKYGQGTLTVKNGETEVANLTVVKMTSCYAKGVSEPAFSADNSQSFNYTGSATELTFEWSSSVYLEGVQVEPLTE